MNSLTKTLLVAFALIFGVAGLISGILIFKNSKKAPVEPADNRYEDVFVEPSVVSPTELPIPTPTPEPKEYSVSVLNGSGIPGQAGVVKTLLEEGEITEFVELTAGNADAYDYVQTEIRSKEVLPEDLVTRIKAALVDYDVVVGDPLESDAENDIEVIVGQKNN